MQILDARLKIRNIQIVVMSCSPNVMEGKLGFHKLLFLN